MFATATARTLPHPDSAETPVAFAQALGRYRVLREIGSGGMGRVLEAWDPELRRSVAIKVLHAHTDDDEAEERFLAEARVTSQLEHPAIVPVHDIGRTPDGRLYFAMKYVTGRSLREVLRALAAGDRETVAAWSRPRLLDTFARVCEAVAYAHDRGVLHRDLKPDNIMVGAFGEVLVLDWGVARVRAPGADAEDARAMLVRTPLTEAGTAVGTPGYMSPEQAMSRGDVGPTADVFSLGAVLFELMTGRRAFRAPSIAALLMAAVSGDLPPFVDHDGEPLPPALVAVIERALAPHAEDRFADALALADAAREAGYTPARRRSRCGLGFLPALPRC